MLRMFSFLPPAGFYGFAGVALAGTWWVHDSILKSGGTVDSKVYVVGGILAFLFAFLGFQKSLEQREARLKPRVSSDEVMQKLTPTETGVKDRALDAPPPDAHGPAENTPLGRLRARSLPSSESVRL